MTALSAGHIAAIAVASSVLCAILAAILAGRIACKKASRNNEDRIEEPASRFYYEMSHELKKGSATPNPAELTLHIALCIDSLVGLRRFDIVPPELIEALKIAVPCDGVVGADWPLWESLLTNTEHENYKNNVDTVLSLLLAHWLVPKLQGTDETMTFLRPDFTSLRNKMMAKPQFDRDLRALQQFWSFMTMTLLHQPKDDNANIWRAFHLPDPSDSRMPGVLRIREALLGFIEPYLNEGFRTQFDYEVERLMAMCTVLASSVFLMYPGEAEFYWEDPREMSWPIGQERLRDDDYFLMCWPGIRHPVGYLGDVLNTPNLEPPQKGLLPPPEREWLRVAMDIAVSPIPAAVSIYGRVRKEDDIII